MYYTKNVFNVKLIIEVKLRAKNMSFLEENMGEHICYFGLAKNP